MLPGFRFLFAAIVLSMSVLVFGLGAAALLRAAHEQFASMPSRRAPPETVFAQPSEPSAPTLALLRVEPVEEKAPDNGPVAAAPAEQNADPVPPAEPEKLAALKPEDTPQPEAAKPDIPAAETTPAMPAAPAQTETPAPADEPKLAAIAETPPPVIETAPVVTEATPAASEQAAVMPSPETSIAATRIATLGGPRRDDRASRSGKSRRDAGPQRRRKASPRAPAYRTTRARGATGRGSGASQFVRAAGRHAESALARREASLALRPTFRRPGTTVRRTKYCR